MKTLLDLLPPREICKTLACGNAAQRGHGFCRDCVPMPKRQVIRRVLLLPVAVLARILEV